MSSRDDPVHGPEDPPQSWIYVPQGPMWDAWNAPGGGAVKLAILATKAQARWLRRARPRPFGFAPGSAHPAPVRIGEAHGAGTLSSGLASVLGLRTEVRTMSIRYGDAADPRTPGAEIISGFHREYQDRDLQEALLKAAGTAAGRRAGAGRAEVTPATIEIIVSGRRRPVAMLRLGEFSAFQAGEDGVLVTVLTRHMGPQFPAIVRLTDLEPMIAAMDNPDAELIATALAELRRQHIEQMRNQNRHRS